MFSKADAKRVSNWTMPFGKYKGMKFGEIDDPEYFEWLVKKTELFNDNPKYKHNKMIRQYLEHIVDCIPFSDISDDGDGLTMDSEDTKILGRYFECDGKKYMKEMDQEGKLWVQFTEEESDFFGFDIISFAHF